MSATDKFRSIKNQGHIIFNSQFLQNFTKVERYEFLQFCHRRTYKNDEVIYYQDDPGTGMYFIESGRVQLIAKSQKENKNYTHTLEPADNLGFYPSVTNLAGLQRPNVWKTASCSAFLNPILKHSKNAIRKLP